MLTRSHPFSWAGAGVILSLLVCGLAACAQTAAESASPLTTARKGDIRTELDSTGFFVDEAGHVLTAGHAARDCRQLYVTKGGHTLEAKLVAIAKRRDLALLKVDETLGLPAVFAQGVPAAEHDMVFAAGYKTLPGILGRGGSLFNAAIADVDREDPHADIELVSDATYGSSGAPVLSASGLVIGVITHKTWPNRVFATNGDEIEAFMRANHVNFEQDDRPQLSALQDHAHRAATISVGVTCFK